MSRHSSKDRMLTIGDTETLEIIQEEQSSPADSSVNIKQTADYSVNLKQTDDAQSDTAPKPKPCFRMSPACICRTNSKRVSVSPVPEVKTDDPPPEPDKAFVDKILTQRENELRSEFNEILEKELNILKEKFDQVLQNEQIRASFMLREAHRERQEKIAALQTQLECKNLAALMFVMASERRNSKLEKLRIIEEYTKYINTLQTLLWEGQGLILNLSRGYKTAARVDHEWREKMKKVVTQNFVHNFMGGEVECNQYFFDLPKLLTTKAPIEVNPDEDPCEEENPSWQEEEIQRELTWWERLQSDCRPFVMFGDMADFKPPQRRDVLREVKAAKTAPKKWKEYVFNEMFLNANCSNADSIKNEYQYHQPAPGRWECHAAQTRNGNNSIAHSENDSHYLPNASIDLRGNMGSILKIMTGSNNPIGPSGQRATLLGARDSIELASATKIRVHKESRSTSEKVVLKVTDRRRVSMFDEVEEEEDIENPPESATRTKSAESKEDKEEEEDDLSLSHLGSVQHDSLEVLKLHKPDHDAKINYERVCPMDKCQRLQVDSFIRSLPPYMQASPFTHFEQTFDGYEPCSPEQIKILAERIEHKKKKEKHAEVHEEDPLAEWCTGPPGVGVQTSVDSLLSFPPCTCHAPSPTPQSDSSAGHVYDIKDLLPTKQMIDHVANTCLYDTDNVDLNRFKVIGQGSEDKIKNLTGDFKGSRYQDIKRILEQHPSLCEIFQSSPHC